MQSIYLVMDLHTDRCIYVGSTGDISTRRSYHRGRFKPRMIMVCEIRKAPKETAHIIEGQVIRAYKRRGEAEFNKVLHPIPNNKFSPFALYYEHYKENILGKWDPRTRTHYPKGTERPKYIPTKKELALVDRVNEYLASVKDN